MPRINAPTVVEHRALQRAALLEAAAVLLASDGVEAVTPKAVGQAAGLARSSVYQYFNSSAELIAAVVEELFPSAVEELQLAVSGDEDPPERLDRYVAAALHIAADPMHRSLYTLAGPALPESCHARVADLHRQIQAPLQRIVDEAVPGASALTTPLLAGILAAGASSIMRGADAEDVVRESQGLLRAALGWTR